MSRRRRRLDDLRAAVDRPRVVSRVDGLIDEVSKHLGGPLSLAGITAICRLSEALEPRLLELIEDARRHGASWEDLDEAMGVADSEGFYTRLNLDLRVRGGRRWPPIPL